jgi:endonuclease/exonuclease/phosphatase family metal-dependent hydrolase
LQGQGTIRVGTYNVENLFDNVDDPHRADDPGPPRERLEALATVIKALDCDILALQEVENVAILHEFNAFYLDNLYIEEVLVEGNDPRGIDVAVLSKLTLINVISFRERSIPLPEGEGAIHFSRDLLAVQWRGRKGGKWTLLTTHLKAGARGDDSVYRTVQAEAIARICREEAFVSVLGPGLTILAGDLNAEPWAEELRALSGVPFSDPARDLPYRFTHVSGKVLDYVLLSPDADARYVVGSARIYRDPPARKASDHFPVYVDLCF